MEETRKLRRPQIEVTDKEPLSLPAIFRLYPQFKNYEGLPVLFCFLKERFFHNCVYCVKFINYLELIMITFVDL